jgi:hypothetical protein
LAGGYDGGVPDETPNTHQNQKLRVDSPRKKLRAGATEAIRFVKYGMDRELASKIAAIVIAFCYLIAFAIHQRAVLAMIPLAVLLIVPLGLIWFPDELGSFTGYFGKGASDMNETPPTLVVFLGWLILALIGVPIVAVSLGYQ